MCIPVYVALHVTDCSLAGDTTIQHTCICLKLCVQVYNVAVCVPVYVASLTAASSCSYFGLKATVNAQSIILPFTCHVTSM